MYARVMENRDGKVYGKVVVAQHEDGGGMYHTRL